MTATTIINSLEPANVIRALHVHILTKMATDEDRYFYTRAFTSDHYSRALITGVLKDLRDAGYVEYCKGLACEADGEFAGAGNGITPKGKEYLSQIIAEADDWPDMDTAPKDQRILVWTGQEVYAVHWVQNPFTDHVAWLVGTASDEETQLLIENPLKWHPCPQPVTTTQSNEAQS